MQNLSFLIFGDGFVPEVSASEIFELEAAQSRRDDFFISHWCWVKDSNFRPGLYNNPLYQLS